MAILLDIPRHDHLHRTNALCKPEVEDDIHDDGRRTHADSLHNLKLPCLEISDRGLDGIYRDPLPRVSQLDIDEISAYQSRVRVGQARIRLLKSLSGIRQDHILQ